MTWPQVWETAARRPVPPFLVVVLDLLIALAVLGLGVHALTVPTLGRLHVASAGLLLLDAVLLAAFVFGEDSYRGNGISRWDAYRSPGGALGPMFALAIVALSCCAVLLGYSTFRDRRRLYASTAFAAVIAAVFLVIPTVVGFSSN